MRFDTAHGIQLSPLEVDFHIPDLGQDARLAIDPFLMYKSRHARLVEWHSKLLDYFRDVVRLVRWGELKRAAEIVECPEPNEIRLGYTAEGAAGSGIGPELARDIVDLISKNEVLVDRGLRHLEELQLYSVGVGADRLSDLVANVLKVDLVRYSAEQAVMWGFPMSDEVGLSHAWSQDEKAWIDLITTISVDPDSGAPVLLVPRRVLRRLPWINYHDFKTHYLLRFLGPKRRDSADLRSKRNVIELTRADLGLVDKYVEAKEAAGAEAAPVDLDDRDKSQIDADADGVREQLSAIPTGAKHAHLYEEVCLRILNAALEPDLIDGRRQQRTHEGTQIRDLIFVNDSDHTFWAYARGSHKAFLVTFEVKNKDALTPADLNQLHAYLGDSVGYLGFIISRKGFSASDRERAMLLFNRRSPHSVILSLSDEDLIDLLRWKKSPNGPAERIREAYRSFMTALQ